MSPATQKIVIAGGILLLIASIWQGQLSGLYDIGIPTETRNTIGTFYKVTSVIDGDTIHVDINGTDEKIRLIGINSPETSNPRTPVQCFGKEAARRMRDLSDKELVRLEYDDTQGTRDVYSRLLAYVYLEDGEMLNRKMIAEGYAYEYTYLTPYKHQKEFRDVQTIARVSERGLWAEDICNGSKLNTR